jgi:hypothetical protein
VEVIYDHNQVEPHQPGKQYDRPDGAKRWLRTSIKPDANTCSVRLPCPFHRRDLTALASGHLGYTPLLPAPWTLVRDAISA